MLEKLTVLDRLRRWYRFLGESISEVDADLVAVMSSAALLEVSEYRFFELAHRHWFGRPVSCRRLEPIFDEYLRRDVVPHWVRHLARQVHSLHDRGRLDREYFDLERPEITAEMRTRGILGTAAIFVLMVVFCVLISGYNPF